jgi:hypothetical protein
MYRRISGRLLITPATTVAIINARINFESVKIPPQANAAFSVNQIDSTPVVHSIR